MNAIQLTGVSKRYGENKVLSGVGLSLASGRFYALLGHNGAGKSTLMRILMRQEAADAGGGSVLGVPLSQDVGALNLKVGYVTEAIVYNVGSTNLETFFKLYASVFPAWDEALFQRNMAEMKLDLDKYFGELSRGQRMQVAFAAALSTRPELLLLDEITSVLDAHARAYFMKELAEFVRKGGTVVMATNLVSEVHEVADAVVLIEGGKIRLNSSAVEVAALFKKVRRKPGADHAIFKERDCVEIGVNSDKSTSYVVPIELLARHSVGAEMTDRRAVTIEDAFIYFTNVRKA